MVSKDARGLSHRWIGPVTGMLLVSTMALAGCGTGPESAGTVEPDSDESVSGGEGDDVGAADGEGGDGQEDEAAEPTPKPASSEGPGEDLPVPEAPEEVDEDTHEGAEAAMRHWFELFVHARNTGDVEPAQELSHEDCASCDGHIEQVEEVFEGEGWFVQDPHEIPYVEFTDIDTGAVGGIFMLNESDFDAYWANEYQGTTEGTPEQIWTGHLEFTDEGWKVLSVRYEMPAAESDQED